MGWLAASSSAFGSVGDLQELSGLDIGMGQQMGLEVGPLVEASLTNGTSVGRLLHVQDSVDGQGPRLAEAFAAFIALERLLFRVDVSVVTEVVLPTEGLAADITVEGSLIGVGSFMDEEVV